MKNSWILLIVILFIFFLGFVFRDSTPLQPSSYFKKNILFVYETEGRIVLEQDEQLYFSQMADATSMAPTLSDFSVVIWVNATEGNLHRGDIVIIPRKAKTDLIHRIVSIDEGRYITKGDNNKIADSEEYGIGDIQGKVVGILY